MKINLIVLIASFFSCSVLVQGEEQSIEVSSTEEMVCLEYVVTVYVEPLIYYREFKAFRKSEVLSVTVSPSFRLGFEEGIDSYVLSIATTERLEQGGNRVHSIYNIPTFEKASELAREVNKQL